MYRYLGMNMKSWLRALLTVLVGAAFATSALAAPPFVQSPIGTHTADEDDGNDTFNLNSVFRDPEGLPMTFTVVSNNRPDLVTASIPALGSTLTLSYVPNENGIATIIVRATDVEASSVTDTITLDLRPKNDNPTIVGADPMAVSVTEDTAPVNIDVSGVVDDIDLTVGDFVDSLTYTVSSVSNTSLVTSSNMSGAILQLTLAANGFGNSTIQIEARDIAGANVKFDVALTVTAVNDPPTTTGVKPIINRAEDSGPFSVSIAGMFADVDGPPLSYLVTAVGNPALFSAGPSISGSNLTFTPALNQNGSSSVTIRATDGTDSVTDDVTITITPVNDAPTVAAPPGPVTVLEDSGPGSASLAGVFSDVDGDPLTLSYVSHTNPTLFTATPSVSGTTLSFTPAPNANGSSVVTIRAQDPGGLSVTTTVTINVTPVNDAPGASGAVPSIVVNEDSGASSTNLASVFTDVDGDPLTLTVTGFTNPGLFSSAPTMSGNNLTFTPALNQNGASSVTVEARDPSNATASVSISVTVTPVNDAPTVVAPPGPVTVLEDSGPGSASFAGVFTDVDGDPLTLSYVSHTNGPLFSPVPSVSGTTLNFTPAPNANGSSVVTVRAQDPGGLSVTTTIGINVTAVNDPPTVANPLPDITRPEDAPPLVINVASVFADVDIGNPSDTLTFSATSSNTALVTVAMSGSSLTLTQLPDANGTATITVTATDSAGASVSDPFVLTVDPVNDIPVAAPDSATMSEDGPAITINVMANDYLAETPTTITRAGVTLTIDGQTYPNSSESAPTTVNDPFGNPATLPNGTVSIQGTSILYEPKANFTGTDFFTYVITDSDGDSSTGTVTIQVNAVNDPPIGVQERSFTMQENSVLTVPAGEGVLKGAYDVDGKTLDSNGNEIGGQTLSASISTLPINGVLTFNNASGAFVYTPFVNFTGTDQFTYRISDGVAQSPPPAYVVRIVVTPAPPPVPPPPPGEVVTPYNLSNTPLEQLAGVPSNVLVVMDDSGSMDWHTVIAGTSDGGLVVSNADVATQSARLTNYVYLFDLSTNAYPSSSDFGRVLPTQQAIDADVDMTGNTYGVWRGRSAKHNSLYYDPTIRYEPWIGQDINNVPFANANPTAARLNPIDPTKVTDLTQPVSYTATQVPRWRAAGGTKNVAVNNFYRPSYWATTASPPIAWNAPRTLVEIKPGAGPLAGGLFPGGPARIDCAVGDGDPSNCTYGQEIQNFANWFAYYRSREYVTKYGIGSVVARVQDLRVGYDTISNSTSQPIRQMNDSPSEGNKKILMDNIYKVSSFGGTPLRQALDRAGKTFACSIGNNCPILPAPDGTCQRNFALLFSDGYWNGGAGTPSNEDVDGPGPFDGGRYSDGVNATLGDVAMKYYETDLWPGLDNRVPVSARDIAGAPAGTFTGANPLMHQHMKTYAIGFGLEGTISPNAVPNNPVVPFAWPDPFSGSLEKIDDMVHAAVNGRGTYVNASNPQQLKAAFESAFLEFTQAASSVSSAAFNSTSLREGTLLYRGFFDLRDNTGDLTATRVATDGTLAATPTWRAAERLDTMSPVNRVVVTFDRAGRRGTPFQYPSLTPSQQASLTASKVDFIRGSRADELPGGTLRARPATRGLLGDIVNSSPVFVGEPRAINRDQAPYPTSSLYSAFASAKRNRTPVVYVGANDGMLHGFHATQGDELFAYVPNKLIDGSQMFKNDLERFTSPFYSHQYYVDLTPRLNDAFIRASVNALSKSWNSVLIGGLGVGGKGYFALNITDPDTQFATQNTATSSVLWEFTDADDSYPNDINGSPLGGAVGAIVDPTGAPVKDLGYAVTTPTVAMSNVNDGTGEKKWMAVFGNGVNSTAGIAKLFVLFVDDGLDGWDSGDFVKLTTGVGVPNIPEQRAGFPNALGTPALVDKDLNGTVDLAYAGDLIGNLYRFDLSDPNPANWKVTRLFTASYDDGVRQPITKQPLVVKHPTKEGFVVIFGTGSYVSREDASNQDIQSVYGIWDRLESSPPTAAPDTRSLRLIEQTVTNVVEEVNGTLVTRRVISKNPVPYQAETASPGVYGWYFDFDMRRATTTTSGNVNTDSSGNPPPLPQFPGEKAIRRLVLRDGTVLTTTVLPSTGQASCFGARPGARRKFYSLTGGDPGRPVVDFNNDGLVNSSDLVPFGGEAYAAGVLFNQQDIDGSLVDISTLGGEVDTDFLFVSGGNETIALRIADLNDSRTGRLSWRELPEAN